MKINEMSYESDYELAYEMFNRDLHCDLDQTVCCIADYEHIKELLMSLVILTDGEIEINDINLEDKTDYDKEYVLTLGMNGISIEKMYIEDRYLYVEDDYVFMHEDCNSKMLQNIINKNVEFTVFSYDFEHEDDEFFYDDLLDDLTEEECYCMNCECRDYCEEYTETEFEDVFEDELELTLYDEDEEESHGFSFTKTNEDGYMSYSFYSTDEDKVNSMIEEVKRDFFRK